MNYFIVRKKIVKYLMVRNKIVTNCCPIFFPPLTCEQTSSSTVVQESYKILVYNNIVENLDYSLYLLYNYFCGGIFGCGCHPPDILGLHFYNLRWGGGRRGGPERRHHKC